MQRNFQKKPKDDVKKGDVSRDDSPECRSDSAVSSPDVFPSSFVRDSSRKSLSNQLVMAKWLDAQERTVDSYEVLFCFRLSFSTYYCRSPQIAGTLSSQDMVNCSAPFRMLRWQCLSAVNRFPYGTTDKFIFKGLF